MQNYKFLIVLIFSLWSISSVSASVIYSKDGNNLEINTTIDLGRTVSNFSHLHSIRVSDNNDKVYLSILGSKKINNDIISYNNLEYIANIGNFKSNLLKPRNNISLFFLGLKSNKFGSIDYGRNYGIMEDTNLIHKNKVNTNEDSFKIYNTFMIGKSNKLLTYRNNHLFGFSKNILLSFQYQGKDDSLNIIEKNEYSLGSSIKYKNKLGFTASGAFFYGKRGLKQSEDMQGNIASAYALSVKYENHKSYLSAFYGKTHNVIPCFFSNHVAQDNSSIKLLAGYNFLYNLNSSISYSSSNINNISYLGEPSQGMSKYLSKKIELSTFYHLKKNVGAYLNYSINLLPKNNYLYNTHYSTHDNMNMGLIYKF